MKSKIGCMSYSFCRQNNRINMLTYILVVLLNCLFSTVRSANPVKSVHAVSAETGTTGDTVMPDVTSYFATMSRPLTGYAESQIYAVTSMPQAGKEDLKLFYKNGTLIAKYILGTTWHFALVLKDPLKLYTASRGVANKEFLILQASGSVYTMVLDQRINTGL